MRLKSKSLAPMSLCAQIKYGGLIIFFSATKALQG